MTSPGRLREPRKQQCTQGLPVALSAIQAQSAIPGLPPPNPASECHSLLLPTSLISLLVSLPPGISFSNPFCRPKFNNQACSPKFLPCSPSPGSQSPVCEMSPRVPQLHTPAWHPSIVPHAPSSVLIPPCPSPFTRALNSSSSSKTHPKCLFLYGTSLDFPMLRKTNPPFPWRSEYFSLSIKSVLLDFMLHS